MFLEKVAADSMAFGHGGWLQGRKEVEEALVDNRMRLRRPQAYFQWDYTRYFAAFLLRPPLMDVYFPQLKQKQAEKEEEEQPAASS